MKDAKQIAEEGLVYKVVVGSKCHGTNVPGKDDTDIMGVAVEPPEYVLGLHQFEQWTFREQAEGIRSQPGDVEGVIYGLKKYVSLCLKGNPSILASLFVGPEHILECKTAGFLIRSKASIFASKKAGYAFLNYARSQRERLAGERGQMRVHRPELVEKYGYDTTYAGHIIRLTFQGIEYMNTGRITLPMQEHERELVRNVRLGGVTFTDFMGLALQYDYLLKQAIEKSALPDSADFETANSILMDIYTMHWGVRWVKNNPDIVRLPV